MTACRLTVWCQLLIHGLAKMGRGGKKRAHNAGRRPKSGLEVHRTAALEGVTKHPGMHGLQT